MNQRLKRILALPVRCKIALKYSFERCSQAFSWLANSSETTNFTYDLTDLNYRYMSHFLSFVVGRPQRELMGYMEELRNDRELVSHIIKETARSEDRFFADDAARYGRRLGWYAIVRATRPRLVVETGVDKGLGAVVLCAALRRNDAEGFSGRYIGTDINPSAGYLLAPPYDEFGSILYGDSLESLATLDGPIDTFINDSDHSVEYEAREFVEIWPRLGEEAIVIGDNAYFSDRLVRAAEEHGKRFLYFQEQPNRHWYPGSGIGVAF